MLKTNRKLWYMLALTAVMAVPAMAQRPPGDMPALARQYLENKEYDKAIPIYKSLYEAAPFDKPVYSAYLESLTGAEQYTEAEQLVLYMAKIRRDDPAITLDLAKVYALSGKEKKAKEQYDLLLESINGDDYVTQKVADAFVRAGNDRYAINVYEKARSLLRNPYAYATELASLYASTGEPSKATEALLDAVMVNPENMESVKEALLRITGGDSKKTEEVQKLVSTRLKMQPENPFWAELLNWTFIQKGDYAGALRQITELDKKLKEDGNRVLNFAAVALKDGRYDIAVEGYDYVLAKGENGYLYERAFAEKLMAQLGRLKAVKPADSILTREVIRNFRALFERYPQQQSGPLVREYALVQSRYALQTDSAIATLETAIAAPNIPRELVGYCKLDLGDYYILEGKIWDASLIYSQVDKAFRQDVLGEEARFRNAKLAYYRGDFPWAQDQLSVLKASTTELIANDALYLSVLITENTPPDSNLVPLLRFATADLLLFQNRTQASDVLLDSIANAFPNTPLLDDILMLRAKIAMEEGRDREAVVFLQKVLDDYGEDVLGDDAAFRLGTIYKDRLKDKDKALAYFEQLIVTYPGSTYVQAACAAYNQLKEGAASTKLP